MSIRFYQGKGQILICNFDGFKDPEMIKKRPVITLTPPKGDRLCTIVPLSTTTPRKIMSYHYKLDNLPPISKAFTSPTAWVKCDMIYTVSYERLTMPTMGKDETGRRVYTPIFISDKDFNKIMNCTLTALGIRQLVYNT